MREWEFTIAAYAVAWIGIILYALYLWLRVKRAHALLSRATDELISGTGSGGAR